MDKKKANSILEEIDRYFAERIGRFGISPQGAGWKNPEAQKLRFKVMCELVLPEHRNRSVSIHEIGCGMAHMMDYLAEKGFPYDYSGSDALTRMLEIAMARHPDIRFTRFNILIDPPIQERYDYVVMNGVFHYLAEGVSWGEWKEEIRAMIKKAWQMTRVGMAFNLMTDMVDWKDPHLFYINPCEVIPWIRESTRLFVIKQDYWPFEFSVFAYREEMIDR
ncbi:MAG: class I SAM-dependent methyltransferase [candidate division WOR-3 bacterium]